MVQSERSQPCHPSQFLPPHVVFISALFLFPIVIRLVMNHRREYKYRVEGRSGSEGQAMPEERGEELMEDRVVRFCRD